jgi:hypothetical protein
MGTVGITPKTTWKRDINCWIQFLDKIQKGESFNLIANQKVNGKETVIIDKEIFFSVVPYNTLKTYTKEKLTDFFNTSAGTPYYDKMAEKYGKIGVSISVPVDETTKVFLKYIDEENIKTAAPGNSSQNKKHATDKTQAQERSTAWVVKCASTYSQLFKTKSHAPINKWEDLKNCPLVMKGEGVQEKVIEYKGGLEGIWGEIPTDDWMENFYYQYKVILQHIKNNKFEEFDRDSTGGFMNFIRDEISTSKIVTFQNWTPADIWLIKDREAIEKKIRKVLGDVNHATLHQLGERELYRERLNGIMRFWFRRELVIGISLKKVKGQAHWKTYNTTEKFLNAVSAKLEQSATNADMHKFIRSDYVFCTKNETDSSIRPRCSLILQSDGEKFINQDGWFFIEERGLDDGKIIIHEYQLRAEKTGNLVISGRMRDAEARSGQLEVGKMKKILPRYRHERSVFESILDREIKNPEKFKKYMTMIIKKLNDKIKLAEGNDYYKEDVHIKNMIKIYNTGAEGKTACVTKFMILSFFYVLFNKCKTADQLNQFATAACFLGQKMGKGYAPFAKVF